MACDGMEVMKGDAAFHSENSSRALREDVPEVAVRWMCYNCDSNIELATLSNVSKKWRNIVSDSILSVTSASRNSVAKSLDAEVFCLGDSDSVGEPCPKSANGSSSKTVQNHADNSLSSCTATSHPLAALLLPSMVAALAREQQNRSKNLAVIANASENSVENKNNDKAGNGSAKPRNSNNSPGCETFCLAWFHPRGIKMVSVNIDEEECGLSDSFNKGGHDSQWGIGNAIFPTGSPLTKSGSVTSNGKSSNGLIKTGAREWHGFRNAIDVLKPFGYSADFIQKLLPLASPLKKGDAKECATTYAVRGATVAKPDRGNSNIQDEKYYNRQLLPRVVLKKHETERGEMKPHQKCIQFLNAHGTRAVCLKTPPWQCGPVSQPVTLFVVGIATEDGVFVSGLKRRFLLGHLCPLTSRDKMTEMSNVCISTDGTEDLCANDQKMRMENLSMRGTDEEDGNCNKEYEDSSDEDDAFSDFSESSEETSSSQLDESEIYRGRTGPGMWHCYTAIFDGKSSRIRVDGELECLDENRSSSCGNGSLDGIMIGSDHKFDMSLCFGEGAEGEGEGTIAELAVFKGRMPDTDVTQMEYHLMNKYDIPKSSRELSWSEDQLKRQAHALLVQPPPWKIDGKRVPLRFAARHPNVAWHRTNNVTGKVIPVSRIGSMYSKGESDW